MTKCRDSYKDIKEQEAEEEEVFEIPHNQEAGIAEGFAEDSPISVDDAAVNVNEPFSEDEEYEEEIVDIMEQSKHFPSSQVWKVPTESAEGLEYK